MKYRYERSINGGSKGKEIPYAYGSTRTACIRISSKGAYVAVEMSKDYSKDILNSYAGNLIKEGIKRIEIAHVLKYAKPLKITDIQLVISDERTRRQINGIEELQNIYCIVKDITHLPKTLGNHEVLQNIMQMTKTGEKERFACLYAYIYSYQQNNEVEKFVYQWIAINGMYSFVGISDNDRASMGTLADKL